MQMKSLFAIKFTSIFCAVTLLFSACEDGEDGHIGANADQYDEMTKYGSITLIFSGKAPDGGTILDTIAYRYCPRLWNSTVSSSPNSPNTHINIERMQTIGDVTNDLPPKANLYLRSVNKAGVATVDEMSLELIAQITTSTNQRILFDPWERIEIPVTDVTEYNYNVATGEVKTRFTVKVPAAKSPTDNELTIAGEVGAIVLETY